MKQGRPVLYELLSERKAARQVPTQSSNGHAPPAPRLDVDDPPLAPAPANWIGAGRSIRLPVGYLFVAAAILIVGGVTAYIFGFARGQHVEEAAWQQDLQSLTESEQIAQMLGNRAAEGGRASSGGTASTSGNQAAPPAEGGVIESDPRQPGLNYFVLIHTTRQNAIAVAEFCRQHGLEAYVPPVNNGDFRVIVLPGYAAEQSGTEAVDRLKQQIEDVRLKWKAHFGKDDLKGYFASKYRG